MTTAVDTASRWTCDGCGVSVSWTGGEQRPLPESWAFADENCICLKCRRERAAESAVADLPERQPRGAGQDAPRQPDRVRGAPHPRQADNTIARACRSSAVAVAAARRGERSSPSRRTPTSPVAQMSSVQIGFALALVAALMANLASLLKHRGCQRVAPVLLRQPLQSIRGLAGSRWFAAGWGLAALAWLVHVAALSMAPISLVQACLAGGAVTLAVMSQGLFGERVARRQWLALLLGAAGLALLALTVPHFSGSHSQLLAGRDPRL